MKKKQKLRNWELAKAVGKSNFFRIEWHSMKETPPQGRQVYVIVKLKEGYYAFTADYLEWTSDPKPDEKGKLPFPPTTFKYFKFDEFRMPEVYLGSPEAKRLVAWGRLELDERPNAPFKRKQGAE